MTTEEKIHIAANFDTEKIKMIRELMEEEAIRIIDYMRDCPYDLTYKIETEGYVTSNELYNIYQQTK